jgi:hypothetical protein
MIFSNKKLFWQWWQRFLRNMSFLHWVNPWQSLSHLISKCLNWGTTPLLLWSIFSIQTRSMNNGYVWTSWYYMNYNGNTSERFIVFVYLLDKVMAYIKDEGGNLTILIRKFYFIITCAQLALSILAKEHVLLIYF